MKSKSTVAKEGLVYVLVFALIQPSTIYLCLRLLHWRFFVSVVLASVLAAGGATLAVWALRSKSVE